MKIVVRTALLLIVLSALAPFSCSGRRGVEPWPEDFGLRVREHIESLTAIAPRRAGTSNEGRAAMYIAGRFRAMGLPAHIEPFDFESFEPEAIDLRVGTERFVPAGLGLDPYAGEPAYSGPFVVLEPGRPSGWPAPADVAGLAAVTSGSGNPSLHFRVSALRPQCIVDLAPEDLERVRGRADRRLTLSVRGGLKKGTSRSVIAQLGPAPPAPQIVVGAHLDAFRECPGANDNASGVAALLELARYLKDLGIPDGIGLTFIAFGAEECGVLGSRRHIEQHAGELTSYRLALVLDDLGGGGPVLVEREGGLVEPPPNPGAARIPRPYRGRAWSGLDYPWSLLPPLALFEAFGTSYHPSWLTASIDEAVKGLGFDVRFTGIQGSDQMPFAQAGIATTGIGAPNDRSHTGDDTPETVDLEKVGQCAKTAARIIRIACHRLRPAAPERPSAPGSSRIPAEGLERAKPMADVRFLASDELRGRRAGSPEGEIAARYVAERFRTAGVEALPGAPEYFQNVVWEEKDAAPASPSGPLRPPRRARNVVGLIRGRDPDRSREFVLVMAHYDHLGAKIVDGTEEVFNGARDNAIGVAALLAAAEALAARPPARSVLILATTAEEEGLIGSRFFVEHPPVPLPRIVFVLNNDGAGVSEPGLWRIGGLERTTAGPLADAAGRAHGLATRPYPEKYRYLFSKGDAASFADRGIPSLTVSPGFAESQVEHIARYVHTPADRVDSDFDEDYLLRFCRAFVDFVRAVSDAESVPASIRRASSSFSARGGPLS